jgi:hypothetical protein
MNSKYLVAALALAVLVPLCAGCSSAPDPSTKFTAQQKVDALRGPGLPPGFNPMLPNGGLKLNSNGNGPSALVAKQPAAGPAVPLEVQAHNAAVAKTGAPPAPTKS